MRICALMLLLIVGAITCSSAYSQELLKAIEPGTGYSRLKQWAIQNNLLFENFTKDSIVIRGVFREASNQAYRVTILARFCAGDDYSGRLFSANLQEIISNERTPSAEQAFNQIFDALTKEKVYLEVLAGKAPSQDGAFEGEYKLRKEGNDAFKGIAFSRSSEQGSWEVGLFQSHDAILVQTKRSKNELCK